ncbi:MAG: hypothetical protein M3305_14200 [Actinomycetota bacterium]|nr:hypothetical protein [Actinomycetota bacterium]
MIENNPVSFFVAIGVLVLALVLIFVVLYAISSGALAESVAILHRGEAPRFSTVECGAGIFSFWRVLGQDLSLFLIGIALFVCLIVLALVLVFPLTAPLKQVPVRERTLLV